MDGVKAVSVYGGQQGGPSIFRVELRMIRAVTEEYDIIRCLRDNHELRGVGYCPGAILLFNGLCGF